MEHEPDQVTLITELGVPQRTILGPIPLKIYVNCLPNLKINGTIIISCTDGTVISVGKQTNLSGILRFTYPYYINTLFN